MLKLILAGILGIPCLLVAVITAPILAILSIPSLLLLLFRKDQNDVSTTTTAKTHVIIIGGSRGIGLAIAKECAKKKDISKITILARNKTKLDEAKKYIIKEASYVPFTTMEAEAISVSVTDYSALEKISRKITKKEERTIIFNCAGIPYTTEYDRIPIEVYDELVQTNLIGSMYVTRAFPPLMVNGCLVFCSSAAGQVGMYGYTAYSPTKFALRGFAEALHAELIRSKPGVSIQVAFPVDTDTPGYAEEKKMMPEITKVLNATAGLATPEDTAKVMVCNAFAKNPNFQVHFTLAGWMLSNLTAGMSPVSNLSDAVVQVALSGLFRLISLFILNDWWMTIRKFRSKEKNNTENHDDSKID